MNSVSFELKTLINILDSEIPETSIISLRGGLLL